MEPPPIYIIVHKAAKERLGVLASQVAHAARECMNARGRDLIKAHYQGEVMPPMSYVLAPDNERICILEAPDSAELERLSNALTMTGVDHFLLREPGPPWNDTATAIGIDHCDRSIVKPIVAHLKLLM